MTEQPITNTILMIRPVAFGYNEQTALNNHFQNQPTTVAEIDIQKQALKEFDQYVSVLRRHGIHVLVIEDTHDPLTPDSIFPNNWITLHEDGRVGLYPMFAENRRLERRPEILEFLVDNGFSIDYVEDFRDAELEYEFLEGTGSLVLDRENKVCYAALSERTHPNLVIEFCEVFNFEPIMFTAFHNKEGERQTIYHTNIVMSVLSDLAIVGLDNIDIEERHLVINKLKETNKQIVELSSQQVDSFAGNVLELKNDNGNKFLVMSKKARSSLTSTQIELISQYCTIIDVNISTIENIGGGSARCMMAEVFLPKN